MYTHMLEDSPQGPSIAAYKGCSHRMQIEYALHNLQFWELTNADWDYTSRPHSAFENRANYHMS